MRGISEERLSNELEEIPIDCTRENNLLLKLINNCQELQEPWMTLDAFLKSEFEGLCWMLTIYNDVVTVKFFDDKFILVNTGVCVPFKFITHVMPIHKPEPPK
jgi:hypothetical protein